MKLWGSELAFGRYKVKYVYFDDGTPAALNIQEKGTDDKYKVIHVCDYGEINDLRYLLDALHGLVSEYDDEQGLFGQSDQDTGLLDEVPF